MSKNEAEAAEVAPTETEAAPKKKRGARAGAKRVVRPLHLLVRVTDTDGTILQFDKSQVSIEVVKDPQVLIDLLTGGTMEGATYVKFMPPVAETPAA
jgi:hypothetical protein